MSVLHTIVKMQHTPSDEINGITRYPANKRILLLLPSKLPFKKPFKTTGFDCLKREGGRFRRLKNIKKWQIFFWNFLRKIFRGKLGGIFLTCELKCMQIMRIMVHGFNWKGEILCNWVDSCYEFLLRYIWFVTYSKWFYNRYYGP